MKIINTPLDQINIKVRFRQPSENKVNEIADSIAQVGLLSPIGIDTSKNLIFGMHRFLAYQKLGKKTIPSIIQESDPKMNELKELVENYDRNDLDLIQLSDHLVKREQLLKDLGLMFVENTNPYDRGNKMSVPELAQSLGFTKRSYQVRKQVSKIDPDVKIMLSGTEFANNLTYLLKLSTEDPSIQKDIAKLLLSGKCKTFKSAFIQSKYKEFKLRSKPRINFNFKERFGSYPQSIMKFQHSNDDLRKVCSIINQDENLRHQKGSLNFGETQIKLHQMNPQQCEFALDYYTQPNDLVLDPFNGRNTTGLTALHLGRRFIGFHIDEYAYKESKRVIDEHVETTPDKWKLYLEDGCEMDSLKIHSECIDAVFTSPPYYGQPEPYNTDTRDLCNMSIEDFDKRIDVMMGNISRLIKKSDHQNKRYYPIIFVVGTYRNKDEGIYDMDNSFQNIAKNHGLTLWDKQFLETNNPHLVCSLQRNFEFKFVHKNYETSLVFVKF